MANLMGTGEGPVRRNNSRVELAVLDSDEAGTELRTSANSTTGGGLHKRAGEIDADHGCEMKTNRAHAESDDADSNREEYDGRGVVWALLRGGSSLCMAPAAWRAFVLIKDDELWLRFCLSGLVIASLLWNSIVFVVPQVLARHQNTYHSRAHAHVPTRTRTFYTATLFARWQPPRKLPNIT